MFVLSNDQMNFVINCLTAKSTWDDLILYHEGPSDVKESRVMDLKLFYNTFKFKEGETLTQTFTRYKALMNELVNDGIKLSKLEINSGFINGLPKKWLSFYQSLRNTNHVKDSELASLFGKLKYEENLIDNKEELSSNENEMVEVKVLMELAEDNDAVSKEWARNGEWVKISMIKVHTLLEMEGNDDRKTYLDYLCIDLNYVEERRNNLFEQISSQKKRILRDDQLTKDPSNSGLKDLVFVKSSVDDTKVSILGVERPWLSEAEGFILPNHDTSEILPAESQRNTTDPPVAVTDFLATDYDSADESLVCSTPLPLQKKLDGAELVSGPKTIKSILSVTSGSPSGPKVVFGDDSTCTTEGFSSIKFNGIVFTKVEFVNGLKDVYVLDMTSSAQESCFFAKASDNLNWLWHKRLAHLNFKTINKLVKQNLVIGLPSLVYSKDKLCSSCEKGKHHRASFKTKQTSSIKKYLHLLHMDLFGLVIPSSINHEKYTIGIVDEYLRYTWVYFLKKKSQAPETIMSFIKRVENQNDIKVKQLRTDNGTEFKNSILVNFCDEKAIRRFVDIVEENSRVWCCRGVDRRRDTFEKVHKDKDIHQVDIFQIQQCFFSLLSSSVEDFEGFGNKTSKNIKKVDVWDSLTKYFIRSFEMYFNNCGSILSYMPSLQYCFEKTDPKSIVL
ncbi:retrovirus-related pol polyprotein from transposon TNT 1-94 [Tanacetum coccineum]